MVSETHSYIAYSMGDSHPRAMCLNPFTLRVPLESIVCYSHTFENNFGIRYKFTKYLKERWCLVYD